MRWLVGSYTLECFWECPHEDKQLCWRVAQSPKDRRKAHLIYSRFETFKKNRPQRWQWQSLLLELHLPITWEIIQTDRKIDEWERRFSLESISLEELWNPLIQTPLGLYSVSWLGRCPHLRGQIIHINMELRLGQVFWLGGVLISGVSFRRGSTVIVSCNCTHRFMYLLQYVWLPDHLLCSFEWVGKMILVSKIRVGEWDY